jgi:capsular polysaccharide biosynthesis protein
VELRRYLAILRRRLLLIFLTVAAGLGAGYASTSRVLTYTADTRIYVGSRQLSFQNSGFVNNANITAIEQVIHTYALMIKSRPIAEEALRRVPGITVSPDALAARTTAFGEPESQLLRIRVSSADPSTAQQLANAVSDAFVEKIQTYDPSAPPEPGQLPQLPAYVFERARLPGAPAPNGLARHLILGGLFGFLVSAAIAFLLEYLDITVKSVADAEERIELPVLGVIPYEREEDLLPSAQASVLTR